MTAFTVNPALTADGPGPGHPTRRTGTRRAVVENDDYARFARRIIVSHGGRIATGDIEGLAALAQLASDVDAAMKVAVTGLREAGYSWAEIADRLGVTRQAAHQRFGSGS